MKQLFIKNPDLDGKKIVIYGIDEKAVLMFAVLLQNEIYVDYFCDPKGTQYTDLRIMNKPIKLLEDARKEKNNIFIVLGGLQYASEAEKLEKEGFEVYYDFNLASYEGNSVFLQGEKDDKSY